MVVGGAPDQRVDDIEVAQVMSAWRALPPRPAMEATPDRCAAGTTDQSAGCAG
jgi:hypothetical protein